jgi:pimeloyl-ACP methyl ester carboxylesterase
MSLALTASCATQELSRYDYFRITIDGQQTLGISLKQALIRAVVIFFHGVGGNEFTMTADQAHKDFAAKLVNAGFAVVSSNAGGDAWGNPASQKNYVYLGGAAAQHYGTENLFFIAESMGAIAATNLLASGPTLRVRGFAAINPVLNLADVAPQYRSVVDEIYPNRSADAVDPMKLPVEAFHDRKMRFYVSRTDSLVDANANAYLFKARFGDVADISVVDCSGQDGDVSCLRGDDVVEWFSQLEKRS